MALQGAISSTVVSATELGAGDHLENGDAYTRTFIMSVKRRKIKKKDVVCSNVNGNIPMPEVAVEQARTN